MGRTLSRWNHWTFCSLFNGDKTDVLLLISDVYWIKHPKHDLFLTLTKLVLCLNLTGSQAHHCYKTKVEKFLHISGLQKHTLPKRILMTGMQSHCIILLKKTLFNSSYTHSVNVVPSVGSAQRSCSRCSPTHHLFTDTMSRLVWRTLQRLPTFCPSILCWEGGGLIHTAHPYHGRCRHTIKSRHSLRQLHFSRATLPRWFDKASEWISCQTSSE